MADRRPRRWIWIALMAACTLWYAWPQGLYSLIPLFDVFQALFPVWAQSLRPWTDLVRSAVGG